MPKPFENAEPMSTLIVFDQSELAIVDALLTSLLNRYNEDDIDEFYFHLRAIREDIRSNMPEVMQ